MGTKKKTPPKKQEGAQAPLHHRLMPIAIAFFSGGAVMVVELAANRVLAPWFGNSLYTWTGLIGVILIALSGGYYLGGWLADRRPDYTILAYLLGAAGLTTLAVPLLCRVLDGAFDGASVVWGPVFATLVIFAVPGILLGTVSPFVIRLVSLQSQDTHVGLSAGTVGTASTLGSVIGTFAGGFLLVPHLRIESIFVVIGLLLIAAALAARFGLVPGMPHVSRLLVLFLAAAGLTGGTYAFGRDLPEGVLFEKTTFYHRIRVTEEPAPGGERLRLLYLDTSHDGAMLLPSGRMALPCNFYWALAKAFQPRLEHIAVLGGGTHTMPKAFADGFPEAEVDVVEIDPEVIRVAETYFAPNNDPRVHAHAADGRLFLRQSTTPYGLIFGDAYQGVASIPAHLVTREFFTLCRDRLTPDGIFMMNLIGFLDGDPAALFRAIARTLQDVFPHVYVFATEPKQTLTRQNIIFAAAARPLSPDPHKAFPRHEDPLVNGLLRTYILPTHYDLKDAPILTDSYNPVEYLVARTLRQAQ